MYTLARPLSSNFSCDTHSCLRVNIPISLLEVLANFYMGINKSHHHHRTERERRTRRNSGDLRSSAWNLAHILITGWRIKAVPSLETSTKIHALIRQWHEKGCFMREGASYERKGAFYWRSTIIKDGEIQHAGWFEMARHYRSRCKTPKPDYLRALLGRQSPSL